MRKSLPVLLADEPGDDKDVQASAVDDLAVARCASGGGAPLDEEAHGAKGAPGATGVPRDPAHARSKRLSYRAMVGGRVGDGWEKGPSLACLQLCTCWLSRTLRPACPLLPPAASARRWSWALVSPRRCTPCAVQKLPAALVPGACKQRPACSLQTTAATATRRHPCRPCNRLHDELDEHPASVLLGRRPRLAVRAHIRRL